MVFPHHHTDHGETSLNSKSLMAGTHYLLLSLSNRKREMEHTEIQAALFAWLKSPVRRPVLILASAARVKPESIEMQNLYSDVINLLEREYPDQVFFSTDGMFGAFEACDVKYTSASGSACTVGITHGFPTLYEMGAVLVLRNCAFMVCVVMGMEREAARYCIEKDSNKEHMDLVYWGPESNVPPVQVAVAEKKRKEKKPKTPEKIMKTIPNTVAFCPAMAPIVLEDDGMDMYKCCICWDIPPFPWQSCSNGHLICPSCYGSARFNPRICPACKENVTVLYKQRILEETVKKFNIPILMRCRNEGCDLQIPLRDMGDHEMVCSHRHYVCPHKVLFGGTVCDWKGSLSAFHEHLQSRHKALIMEKAEFWMQASDMGKTEHGWVVPSMNLYATDSVIKKGGMPLPVLKLYIGSLTKDPISVCVDVINVRTEYRSRILLRAPSFLSDKPVDFIALLKQERATSFLDVPLNRDEPTDEVTIHIRPIHVNKKRKSEEDLAVLIQDRNIDREDPADDLVLLADPPLPLLKRRRVDEPILDDPMVVDEEEEEEEKKEEKEEEDDEATAPIIPLMEEEEEDNPYGKE
jgi:hypothetical protein